MAHRSAVRRCTDCIHVDDRPKCKIWYWFYVRLEAPGRVLNCPAYRPRGDRGTP